MARHPPEQRVLVRAVGATCVRADHLLECGAVCVPLTSGVRNWHGTHDELGYPEHHRRHAELLLHVLTDREERASTATSTKEAFDGWTKTFTDPRLWRGDRYQWVSVGNVQSPARTSCRGRYSLTR